jgi:hypothetical protein
MEIFILEVRIMAGRPREQNDFYYIDEETVAMLVHYKDKSI